MTTNAKTADIHQAKENPATLWVLVMLNIALADIVGVVHLGALEPIMSGVEAACMTMIVWYAWRLPGQAA